MATRTTTLHLVCCTYEGKKFNVPLREGMKTRDIIVEAAKIVNVRPERLSVLWCGQVIKPDVPIQDAIANRSATDLHLVQLERADSFTSDRTVDDGQIYVYCKECEGIAMGRQILICNKCNEKNKFVRNPSDRSMSSIVKMFEAENKIDGVCTNQKCSYKDKPVTAQVRYQCKGCDNSAAVLKHMQKNTEKIPCMKCNNARSIMFVFCCDYLHAMCVMCFSGFCQMQMNNKKFQIFDNVGYSVTCPASTCPNAPVRDPHHFYVVNRKFYEMFQYEAAKCYVPAGNNIFCTCYTEIIVGSAGSDAVAATRETAEQGGRWWSRESKSSKKSAAKKKPTQRRRVTCPNTECGKAYCVECKSFWHDGDCVARPGPSDDDVFDVSFGDAARWPQQP